MAKQELTLKDRLSRLTYAQACKTHLQTCLETDEQGRIELKLKLPDVSALEGIAAALANLSG